MAEAAIIHVIDDDEAIRLSLTFLLETAGFQVRAYDSALAFLDRLDLPRHGCVVTDVRMPDMDGLTLQRTMMERQVMLPVIVMTGHGDVPVAVQALKAGAADFIEKPFDDELLIRAIHTALERNRREQEENDEAAAVAARLSTLTPREVEVLAGLVKGHPNKTVAYDLGISARTVEVHRARVMDKMQARSLSELVRMWLSRRARGGDAGE
jgi:two-component system response regulator FixJ